MRIKQYRGATGDVIEIQSSEGRVVAKFVETEAGGVHLQVDRLVLHGELVNYTGGEINELTANPKQPPIAKLKCDTWGGEIRKVAEKVNELIDALVGANLTDPADETGR